jgi:selenocysteine lyase
VKELGAELKTLNEESNGNFLLRDCPLYLHTDAAQAIGKILVNVEELNVDYLTIVGHKVHIYIQVVENLTTLKLLFFFKFYGPRIGALFARSDCENAAVSSLFFGAGQENGLRPG